MCLADVDEDVRACVWVCLWITCVSVAHARALSRCILCLLNQDVFSKYSSLDDEDLYLYKTCVLFPVSSY
jgi:hypothetical protein